MFDVIIPLYKVNPLYFEKCLQSICYDTQKKHFAGEYKIFVIDKTPTNWEFYNECINLINLYEEIEYIKQDGEGVSNARNQGVQLGNNPYICFLDADDYWYDSHLFELAEIVSKSSSNVVMWWTAMDMFMKNPFRKNAYTHFVINHIENFLMWDDELHFYYLRKNPICTSTVCLERNRFENVNGYSEKYAIGEDIELWTRMIGNPKTRNKNYLATQIPVVTAYKHIHEENTTEGGSQSYLFENNQNIEYRNNQLAEIASLYETPRMDEKPNKVSLKEWEKICQEYSSIK